MTKNQLLETEATPMKVFHDLLDRESLADNFVKVINSQNAKVYSINAPWGAGKTCFLKFVENYCKNNNIPFTQYNIWETDYLDNPLQSILNEFLNFIDNLEYKNYLSKEVIDMSKTIKRSVADFTELIRNFGFHFGLSTPLPDNPTISLQAGFSKNPSENIDVYKKMKNLKEDTIKNLKEILKNFPNKKFIIAIDELDRCRPDYAIKTLEVIKHFFDIDNLVFIIAVDKEQLKSTVKVLYGLDTNTDCYLKKFVDVEYLLPLPNTENFVEYLVKDKHPNVKKSFDRLNNEHLLLVKNNRAEWVLCSNINSSYLSSTISNIAKIYTLELRDIEKLILKLSIIIDFLPNNNILCLPFLVDLIILNIYHPNIYNYIKIKSPADNYSDYSTEWRNLRKETFFIIKHLHTNSYTEDCIDQCRHGLKKYFEMIDFAQTFNT